VAGQGAVHAGWQQRSAHLLLDRGNAMTTSRTPEQRARHWASWQIALRTGVAGLAVVTAQTAWANPNGGNVVAGNATINGQGTDRVRIDQSSDRVIINWNNFSIDAGQGVDFRQPNARSIALNRVTGPEISQIMGELTANGQVYIINGNGIVFGKDAKVDVAGLVATSADIGNDAFMAGGSLRFGTPGRSGAKVINHGTISVRDAGIAAFVAPQVANDGIITAHMGKIAFGGAQAFTLDLHGDNLIRFQVGDAVTRLDDKGALVDIGGVVDARGGTLLITASAARDLVNQSVRIGTPQAASMEVGADGKVSLVAAKMTITAPGEVQVGKNVAMDLSSSTNAAVTTGRPAKGGANSNIGWANVIDGDTSAAPGTAMAASGTGGTLTITAARTILDGTINLDGGKAGGTAHITGTDFLSFGSILSASGAEAGGNIQLDAGGFSLAGRITVNAGLGKGGNVDIHTTRRAIDTGDAFIDASGLHGGTIRYTSDQQIISSGKFRASGSHGFGGSIDVSAPRLDLFSAQFYAQGGIRGGRVRLGGEFQGGRTLSVDELMNARTLVATDSVTVDVSAIGMRGNAGEIVIWSDEKTTFLGTAIARGGLVGGVGGQIEISGKETLVYRGTVETARDGQRGGKLLLDPKNIIIANIANSPSQYGLVLQAFASSFPGPVAAQPGIESGDLFGFGVSLDGNRLAVGAPGDDGADGALTNVGAVYLFTFADTNFAAPVLSAVIGSGYTGGRNLSVGGLEAGDQFGFSVSLTDTRLAVGAPFDDGLGNSATDSGAVYLFSFLDLAFNASSTLGVLGAGYGGTASLDVANVAADDRFGTSVSLDRLGNRLAVGASHDDGSSDTATDSGAVYLFSFTDAQFSDPTLESILGFNYSGGKNLSVGQIVSDDLFGYSVSLEGTQLAIGAPGDDGDSGSATDAGAVYLVSFADLVFNSPLVEGIIGAGYLGSKDFNIPSLGDDRLGESVSLNGNRLAVGAPFDDGAADGFFNNGAVYLFTFADTTFSTPRLAAIIGGDHGSLGGRNLSVPQLSFNDNFSKVSLDGNRLVVGAPRDEGRNNDLGNAGAAYLFTFEDDAFNNGRQAGILGVGYINFTGLSLLGNGLEEQDNFGTAVSLDGNRLAIGAPFDDGAANNKLDSGAVYLLSFGDAQFSAPVLQAIIGSGYTGGKNLSVGRIQGDDLFGYSVSLDGLSLAVGAIGDDGINDTASDSGAVYLFSFDDALFGFGNVSRVVDFESITGGPITSDSAQLGTAVALKGTILAVGAAGDSGATGSAIDAGAVHIFDLVDSVFSVLPNRLVTLGLGYTALNDISVTDLDDFDRFGTSLALQGLQLAIGAPGDDGFGNIGTNTGAVFLFTFAASDFSGGSLVATIGKGYTGTLDVDVPNISVSSDDRFGSSVAIDGFKLAVGALADDGLNDTVLNAGAVYLFTFNSGFSGIAPVGIVGANYAGPSNFDLKLAATGQFGASISLDGNRMVVGASNNPGRNAGTNGSGAAYLFTFADNQLGGIRLIDTLGAGYTGQNSLSIAALASNDRFGSAVSLDGTRLAIGAPGDGGAQNLESDSGAVYLFSFADLAFGAPVLEAIIGLDYSGGKNVALGALEAGDLFGSAVALSGLQLAVGAPGDAGLSNTAGSSTGAVYLFTFTDELFSGGTVEGTMGFGYNVGPKDIDLSAVLESGEQFGRSVALANNRLAVGAPGNSGASGLLVNSGAAYMFTFSDAAFNGGLLRGTVGSGYSGTNDIDLSQLDPGDQFGFSIALNRTNDRLFVGSPGDDGETGGDDAAGAVYRFQFTDAIFSGGSLQSTLGLGYFLGSDTAVAGIEAFDAFGSSVAVDGSQLAIGAAFDSGFNNAVDGAGAIYLFQVDDGGYAQRAIIGAGYSGGLNLTIGGLESDEALGRSVSLHRNRLVSGATGDDGVANTGSDIGAVYHFSFTNSGFANLSLAGTFGTGYGPPKNSSPAPFEPNGRFASAVSLLGNRLAIGVPGDTGADFAGTNAGAVFLFTFADAAFNGVQLRGIIGQGYAGANNFDVGVLEAGDFFGSGVSLDGLRLAVGAPGDNGANDDKNDSGAVYLFTFANTLFNSPVLEARVGADYTGFKNVNVGALEADDQFGASVSLVGTQLVVGAQSDDGNLNAVTDAGAVYLFTFSNSIFNGGALVGRIGSGYGGAGEVSIGNLGAGDLFGSAVSLDGLNLAIGAKLDDGDGDLLPNSGAVYLVSFADTAFATPVFLGTIGSGYSGLNSFSVVPLDQENLFGSAVSLSGLQLVVGAAGDTGFSGNGIDWGAAFLFTFSSATLESPNLESIIGPGYLGTGDISVLGLVDGANFGAGVSLNQGRIVIGAPGDDGNTAGFSVGAAYLYTFNGDQYADLAYAGTMGGAFANGTTPSLAAQGINTFPDERFGRAVSLDLNLLAIGSPLDDGASNLASQSGAVYLISFSSGLGQELTAPVLRSVIGSGYTGGRNLSIANLEAGDNFGASVSLFGSFLAIGAPGDDGALNDVTDAGAAYTFSFLNQEFDNLALFSTVGNGYAGANDLSVALDAEDNFGAAVSIALSNLVVGAPFDDGFGNSLTNSGAVYLLLHGPFAGAGGVIGTIGSGYTGLNSLDLTSLDAGDQFGASVSVDAVAQQLAVGAPRDEGAGNIGGAGSSIGAVYTFTFADSQASLVALAGTIGRGYTGTNDGDPGTLDSNDRFGSGVSLNGGRLAIGAPGDQGAGNINPLGVGAVYLYGFASSQFASPLQRLIIGDGYVGAGTLPIALNVGDDFGASVSLTGNNVGGLGLAVGAPFDDGPGNTQSEGGAVYFFLFDDTAFNGGRLVGTIGAGYRSTVGLDLTAPVTPSFVQVGGGDSFGTAVSLDGNRLAIGAPDDDGSIDGLGDSGAVYLFTFADANFGGATLQATIGHGYVGGKNLWPTEIGAGDQFGFSVSLNGNRLAVGAPRDDGASDAQSNAGAVYLFSFTDAAFAGGALEAIIGTGYAGGKNLNTDLFDASPPAVAADDRFGTSVSLDGNRLAVGSPNDQGFNNVTGNATGAVFLFSFADAAFSSGALQARIGAGYIGARDIDIVPDDFDAFGTSVSLDGLRLAVGASGDDGAGNGLANSGAVYLFTFTDLAFNGAIQRGTVGVSYSGAGDVDTVLTPFGFGSGSFFGTSVSLDGNRLAIGGPGINSGVTSPSNSGAVYLLTFTDSIFSGGSIAEIIAKGADNFGTNLDFDVELEAADFFGTSVSLDGNRLVVGATGDDGFGNGAASTDSGAVYLFTFADAAFNGAQLRGTLGAGYTRGLSTPVIGLEANDSFGSAVSLNGNRLAVGAFFDDGFGNSLADSGAVYLFTFADADFTSPVLQGTIGSGYTGGKNLSVSHLRSGSFFGFSVSLDGNRLAVGAVSDRGDSGSASGAGAAYLFTFADTEFTTPQLAGIIGLGYTGGNNFNLALDDADQFGFGISLSGNRLAVGAVGDDGLDGSINETGAVYLFTFADLAFSTPSLVGRIGRGYTGGNNFDLSGTLEAGDFFGSSVSLDGNRLAAGAFSDDGFGNGAVNAGAVYLFTFADAALTTPNLVRTVGALYSGANGVANLESNDFFGQSLDLDGNTLAVGASNDQGAGNAFGGRGAVYLFSFADATFTADPSLTGIIGRGYTGGSNLDVATLDNGDIFGVAVTIDSGRLVVGARADDGPDNLLTDSGAVYFFALGGGGLPGLGFGDNPGADVTIGASALAAILSGGTGVTLQANNDITVNAAILVSNPSGDGGSLTFRAGRSILINAGITTDGGNFVARANDFVASGVVDAFRDSGDAVLSFGAGGFIDAGFGGVDLFIERGDDKTFSSSGAINLGSITASLIFVSNLGSLGTRDVTINTGSVLTANNGGSGVVIQIRSGVFTNNAGPGAINLTTAFQNFLIYSDDYDVIQRGGLTGLNGYNSVIPPLSGPGGAFIFSRQPVLTFTADNATREYGLADPTFSSSFAGLVNGDSAGYAFAGAPSLLSTALLNSNIGTYAINASLGTLTSDVGYGFAFAPGTLTITRALLTVTADNATREYGLANPTFTGSIAGLRAGDTASVVSGLVYNSPALITSNVGTFAINGSGGTATNYNFAYVPGTLTITRALLTVTADNATREYGLANPTFTGSITGFRNSDTASVISGLVYGTPATIASNVGTFAITGSGATATNYNFAYVPGTLTITRALLTVTADNATREYGLANPTFTGSITGFRNSDTASVISGLVYGTVATTASDVGTYAITGSGATATNYNFAYVPGTLTITRALLTVTADNATREYGLANPAFTGSITGFRNSDTASVISGLVYGTVATTASDVGTYAITGSGATATNYNFAYVPGTLTITRALLTVTADNATREYGLANPTFTGSITGFRNSDTASVISGLVYGTVATTASDVGTYAITGSGATATNYNFAYVPGTLTITRALLTVTADNATREYGLANPTFTGSITGFRNSDTASVISGLVYGTVATTASDVGTYAITGSGATATNYNFAYVPGTLTITRALLTVTADNATREYGLANPAFTGSITGFRNSDTASVISGLVYGSAATIASNVGTFAITGSGATATNYNFAYVPGTLTITRALLTVTANNATREYGLPDPVFTGSISGFRNSDTASVVSGLVYGSTALPSHGIGTYVINGAGASATNYNFVYVPGTLTITRALLTVTADNATREYGLANPTFTGSIAGFRNGDTSSVVSGLVYGTPATIASNVGTFAITGSGGTASNYDFAYVPGTLTITKALLTVTANNATREYGLADPTFTGSITGLRNSDTASVISGLVYGSSAVLNSGIGTYSITGSGATSTNYDFSYIPGTLTITRALLTVTADDATREYGLANPTFTGTISGLRAGDTASVVSGLVYGTTANSFSNAGTFAITASGGTAANYNFAYAPGTLTITKALLTVTADNASREYGLANPAFTGSITGFRNSDSTSVVSGLVYNTVADITSNAGTYGIVGAFATATNYDFAYVPGTLTITKALLTVTANNATREYGLADPTFTGSITGLRNSDTASVISGLVYGSSAVLNSGIGTYSITGSGATSTNYDFSYIPGTLTITRALLTVTADDATREYGLANPTFTGTISGLRAGDTASVVSGLVYGTTANSFSNAGTFAITASGGTAANYNFAYAPGTLTITKALLTVTADNASREYGLANPAFTGSITGFRNSDSTSVVSGLVYNTVADITSNAGTYGIVGAFATATNYDFAYVPGTLTITRALLTVTANNATREYGLANPTFTGSITGFRNSDTASVISGLVYGTPATIASNIGTFAITGSGATATNYNFAYVPGTLTITRALLTVTADNATREYGLANPVFTGTISGLRAGDTASVVSGLVYGTTANTFSNAGTFAITASGGTAANYNFAYAPGTLTITKALLTVTADNATREYGLSNPVFTGSITGFRNSDTASVVSGLVYGTVATAASDAGTYSITGSGASATNYDFAYVPGTLTITRALLTVTADNATREYGLTNPAFTGSITGLRNSDTASVISGLVYGSAATSASNVGTFAITGSGATATNYNFAYVPGTLTITRALLTVTADNATREYGLANPAFTGSITGLRNSDTASVISGLVYGSAATSASNVGTFAITGSGATATNYNFAYVPGTLTITRALLTVTADNATREYGFTNPVFTGSITGFRNSDTASVISGLVYGTVATAASDAGTYAITGSGATSTNYDFAYVPGTLTITRALLTVTADNATREYGLANPAFTGSITGFRNSDTASVISGLVYGSAATTASNVGTFAIIGSGATATNYDFAYVPGTLTITRALLTVTADNATREYGLANPTFTGSVSGLRNSDTASVISGLVYGSAATSASNVGTFAITGSGGTATNYNFAYVPGTLTITRALLTVTADNATREYGLANPTFTGTISGLRAGDTASVVSGLVYGTVATTGSNVGTFAISGSGGTAANYNFAYVPGTLTITKALLTVTADNKSREYGLANPLLTSTISGLRNGDTASVASGLVLATGATVASGVGNYAIGVSGGSALNYDFAYVPGTLAVTPAPLTVTIDNKTRVYGGVNPELTSSITGFRNGDTDAVVSGLRLRTSAIARSNAGDYLITGSGANAANYRFDYVPGTLTITKALLQVRVNSASREYGLANPAFTASMTGFRNGDTANVVSGLVLGSSATIGSNVGTYAITASGASALNYDFAYTPGRLTIDQARLLITADSVVMHQGSGDPVLTVNYSGLRNGDTRDVVTGLVLRSSGGSTASPGQYIINASRGSALNYQITYRPGVMTVLPAIVPPAQDPPATGSGPNPPAANPPAANPPAASPPATVTPVTPPASGGLAGTDSGAAPSASQPATVPAPAAPLLAAPAAPVTSMPSQGTVALPVPNETLSPMQVLQGLAAPLPVLVAPETRPADEDDTGQPARGDGQRTGCTYISLCTSAPQPLWTFQPTQ
jgi:filamentous hemagglutinin family protein